MEYTFQKTIAQKVDITLPAFIKYGGVFYKIMDKKMIIVDTYDFNSGIQITNTNLSIAFGNSGWEFVSENVFNEEFSKVYSFLDEFIPDLV